MPLGAIEDLGNRLAEFWRYYGQYTQTKTRDTSEYGYHYLSGLLRMETKRNMANIGRVTEVPVQNMHHYISNSPWSGRELIEAIQSDIADRLEFRSGSVLLLDESADEKAGKYSAGASRQHNGRLGKVELSQVGVFLSLANDGVHTWVDGELYLPEIWFSDAYAAHRQRVGLPQERYFQTKLELGLELIKRAKAQDLPFEAVDCDSLYGRKGWFRDELDRNQIEYYADVPENTQVYLEPPCVSWPTTKSGQKAKKPQVISSDRVYQVKELCHHPDTLWRTVILRPNERGFLKADFTVCDVWTVRDDGTLRQEQLLIRRQAKRVTYSLSNAVPNTPLPTMARRKSQRYFIERDNQDAKSELGWDEFQATKCRAWDHHLALTIAASWFITETTLDWAIDFDRDPDLLARYETDVLPALSVANVRTLLRAAMPLPQLSPLQAAQLVIGHLDNRARSRKSRLRNALGP